MEDGFLIASFQSFSSVVYRYSFLPVGRIIIGVAFVDPNLR